MKKVKRSPKKINLNHTAILMVNATECQTKNIAHNCKVWEENLTLLNTCAEQIHQAIQMKPIAKPTELNQKYSESKSKVSKLIKEIETAQKGWQKSYETFKIKLLDAFATADTSQNPNDTETTRMHIDKIKIALEQDKKTLNEISGKYQTLQLRFISLENAVHQYCLSDQMTTMMTLEERLIACAKSLCQKTVVLSADPTLKSSTATEVKATLLNLFNAHKEAGALLDQIHKNLSQPSGSSPASVTVAAASI